MGSRLLDRLRVFPERLKFAAVSLDDCWFAQDQQILVVLFVGTASPVVTSREQDVVVEECEFVLHLRSFAVAPVRKTKRKAILGQKLARGLALLIPALVEYQADAHAACGCFIQSVGELLAVEAIERGVEGGVRRSDQALDCLRYRLLPRQQGFNIHRVPANMIVLGIRFPGNSLPESICRNHDRLDSGAARLNT